LGAILIQVLNPNKNKYYAIIQTVANEIIEINTKHQDEYAGH
jgi:hypothetical protein